MNFHQLDPQEVIISESLSEYRDSIDFFYREQLVLLNANIYVMEKILNFPFQVFHRMEKTVFFRLVMTNFYFASVLTITRLVTDQSSDFHTLPQFKNWVLKQVKPKYQKEFQTHLRATRFDTQTQQMFKKAKRLRDAQIAHSKRDTSLLFEHDQLNLEELRVLRDILNFLLHSLSFNKRHVMLPFQYSLEQHSLDERSSIWDERSDIEYLLDCIAKESDLLNMPEESPEHWERKKERLPKKYIKVINEYRIKFGLNAI